MKGLFFKDKKRNGYEIVSEPKVVGGLAGPDDVVVVAKRLVDNRISLFSITEIDTVFSSKTQIGF